MLNTYRKIAAKSRSEHCGLSSPQPLYDEDEINVNSEAKKLMVDFTETPATTAGETISVNDTLELMQANRIRAMLLITDALWRT